MYHTYILYSKQLDKYYIGACGTDVSRRLEEHLWKHSSFTSKAKDWEIKYVEDYETKELAYQRERQIKKMEIKENGRGIDKKWQLVELVQFQRQDARFAKNPSQ